MGGEALGKYRPSVMPTARDVNGPAGDVMGFENGGSYSGKHRQKQILPNADKQRPALPSADEFISLLQVCCLCGFCWLHVVAVQLAKARSFFFQSHGAASSRSHDWFPPQKSE